MTTQRKANYLVGRALALGDLTRGECEVGLECDGSIHAHHDDYSKPLDVRWLCARHHAEHHKTHGVGRGSDLDHLKKIALWMPENEAREFEALVKSEGKTMTGAMRVMIREYLAKAKVAA